MPYTGGVLEEGSLGLLIMSRKFKCQPFPILAQIIVLIGPWKLDQSSSLKSKLSKILQYLNVTSCSVSQNSLQMILRLCFKKTEEGFPGGTVVKNRLPMQGTRVWALDQEDPTCRGATKPVCQNYWACALEALSHNYWARVPQLLSPHTTTEAHVPRACAPQQEKPPQ